MAHSRTWVGAFLFLSELNVQFGSCSTVPKKCENGTKILTYCPYKLVFNLFHFLDTV